MILDKISTSIFDSHNEDTNLRFMNTNLFDTNGPGYMLCQSLYFEVDKEEYNVHLTPYGDVMLRDCNNRIILHLVYNPVYNAYSRQVLPAHVKLSDAIDFVCEIKKLFKEQS